MFKLLIVDDDANVREGLALGLADRFQVGEAESADEALALIDQDTPDVILLDQNLGRMRGTQVLESIGQMKHRAPVVVFSAGMSPALARSAVGLGAEDCVTKPFQLDDLRARLLRAVNGRSPRQKMKTTFAERVVDIVSEEATQHEGSIQKGCIHVTQRLIHEAMADCAGDAVRTAERLGLATEQLDEIRRNHKNGEDYDSQEPIAGR